jgi:hypothetical protein
MAPPSQIDQFWRLEDNLIDLGEFWPHIYVARNAHSVFERFLPRPTGCSPGTCAA